jgi:hypothetical protein
MKAPIRDLAVLLANMQPILRDGEFVFCSIPNNSPIPADLTPVLIFVESEGTTLIVPLDQAQGSGTEYTFRSRMITLGVNSALDAVGFLAVITKHLAAAGISVNAISAYHHDHIFVPSSRANEAMQVLSSIA